MTGSTGRPGLAALTEEARRVADELGAGPDLVLVGIGWGTLELDRAERELSGILGRGAGPVFRRAAPDPLLGAAARVARIQGGPAVVLLEPNTEGRLAAALTRWGEGIAAVYVTARGHGAPGRPEPRPAEDEPGGGAEDEPPGRGPGLPGPLGPERRLAGDRHGPHLILVEGPVAGGSSPLRRDTIVP